MTPSPAEIEAAAKALEGKVPSPEGTAEAALTAAEKVRTREALDATRAEHDAIREAAATLSGPVKSVGGQIGENEWKAAADRLRETGEVTRMTIEARTQGAVEVSLTEAEAHWLSSFLSPKSDESATAEGIKNKVNLAIGSARTQPYDAEQAQADAEWIERYGKPETGQPIPGPGWNGTTDLRAEWPTSPKPEISEADKGYERGMYEVAATLDERRRIVALIEGLKPTHGTDNERAFYGYAIDDALTAIDGADDE